MPRRIVRSRHRPDGSAFGTDNANALDVIVAHHDQRGHFVRAEWTGAKIGGSHRGISAKSVPAEGVRNGDVHPRKPLLIPLLFWTTKPRKAC